MVRVVTLAEAGANALATEGNALYGLVQYKCDLLPVVNSEVRVIEKRPRGC